MCILFFPIFLVPGIGHKVKSKNNPDLRVEIVKEYARKHFPCTKLLEYALAVETVTTSKKDNLILNGKYCRYFYYFLIRSKSMVVLLFALLIY